MPFTLRAARPAVWMRDVSDLRNYKVTWERASTRLGFVPRFSVADMVDDLHAHRSEYGDFSADKFYNIKVFKAANIAQGRALGART